MLSDLKLIERRVPFGDNPDKSRKGMYGFSDPFFAYWFRFVGRNASIIESGISEEVARKLAFGPAFDTYVGQQFESVCLQWLIRRNAKGRLPFIATQFGKWWGTDPVAREQTDIDVVAADPQERRILIGECKWRNSINETKVIGQLTGRAGLVPGYAREHTRFVLFTKEPVSRATASKYAADDRFAFVTADDLYADD